MATLADGVWYPMSAFPQKGSSNVYTLVNTGGGLPVIDVSNNGGGTFVNLADASVPDTAVDLVLSRSASIRATLAGAVVELT